MFQSFDWLATWQHYIGARNEVTPAIVVGRDGAGAVLFIFPLSVNAGPFVRELIWLGSELCDYNAPLLAPAFAERVDGAVSSRCGAPSCGGCKAIRACNSI